MTEHVDPGSPVSGDASQLSSSDSSGEEEPAQNESCESSEDEGRHEEAASLAADAEEQVAIAIHDNVVTAAGIQVHFREDAPAGEVGDRSLALSWYSCTVTKSGEDIEFSKLDHFKDFLVQYCETGIVALERGGRQAQLHLQSAFQVHCAKTTAGTTKLNRLIRNCLAIDSRGYKVTSKT